MLHIISDHIILPSLYYVVHSTDELCVIYHAGVFYIANIELGVCMKRVGVFVYGWQVMKAWDKLYSSEDFGKNFWKCVFGIRVGWVLEVKYLGGNK